MPPARLCLASVRLAPPRPLRPRPVLALLCLAAVSGPGVAPAAATEAGSGTAAARLLQTFRCAFAADRCPPDPESAAPGASRCFQPHIARFEALRPTLDGATIREIESYLVTRLPRSSQSEMTYVSPSGTFEFHFETSGPDSVPVEDVDPPNGIPDFVERCAEYADYSCGQEAALGFVMPALPPDETYDISFQGFGPTIYGYTDIAGSTTTIVLNSTFNHPLFPPNDDPDGSVLGRAKATIAHELRHASQYTNNGWTEEPPWDELDAGWVEDIVYPATNDYVNFLENNSLSQLDAPWIPMDSTSATVAGYEDCLWEHYLTETYGVSLVVDLWDHRAEYPSAPMIASYSQVLAQYQTDWDESYPKYLEWCWFTGNRAQEDFGFPDADKLWTMEWVAATNSYPYTAADTVEALAGDPRRFRTGSATGYPRITFDGDDWAENLTLSVLTLEQDGSLLMVQPPLDEDNDALHLVPVKFPDIQSVCVLVTNSNLSHQPAPYTLLVEDDTVTAAGPGGGGGGGGSDGEPAAPPTRLALYPPVPNPLRSSTRLRWSLPRAGLVSLRIVDVTGRVVSTVRQDTFSEREGGAEWTGRADGGGQVGAGVYWAILETEDGTAARPVVRLR